MEPVSFLLQSRPVSTPAACGHVETSALSLDSLHYTPKFRLGEVALLQLIGRLHFSLRLYLYKIPLFQRVLSSHI